ncbi:MAG: hypothetical protein QM759_15945 [Terricaulis sp.]
MSALALDTFQMDGSDDWKGLAQGETDYCSREGALALKAKIEAYWRERGHDVMIALNNVGFHPAIRAARYDVRSDMVNGKPRTSSAKKLQEVFVEDFDVSNDDIAFD